MCQCQTQRKPRKQARVGGELVWVAATTRVTVGGRRVSVPEWVGHSEYDPSVWATATEAPPRFLVARKDQPVPVRLQGASLFRRRCVAPTWFPAVLSGMHDGLEKCAKLVKALHREISDYTGDVGLNAHMQKVSHNAMTCWDWDYLSTQPPKHVHAQAFVALYKAMQPSMQYTRWPVSDEFTYVEQRWPTPRQMLDQYRLVVFDPAPSTCCSGQDT